MSKTHDQRASSILAIAGGDRGGSEKAAISRHEPTLYNVDVFKELGLLSSSGKPRLNVAQGYFRRDQDLSDLGLLEALYVHWRDFEERVVLRSLMVDRETLANVWRYKSIKCSKRGNDVYVWRTKKRLNWLSSMENIEFFNVKDVALDKKVYSQALWITLTYDTKRCSRDEAWLNIGVEYNRFISALRRRYGKVSVLRTWESSARGYPHIHAVLLFHEAKFSVFPHVSMKEGKFTFRISEKDQISELWHSPNVDIQAVSSTKKLFNYITKYQTKTLMNSNSPNGVKTMAMMWLFGKRGFSVSGDFRSQLHDLIRLKHNSNMVEVQSRLDGSLEDKPVWEFVGVFSSKELGISCDRWVTELNKEQIEAVLRLEAQLPKSYGVD